MPAPVRVAILGFSAFERSAITSYFGLNPGRMPRYELVDDVDEARMVVADADQPGVAVLLRTLGRTAQAVFIGEHPPAHAGAWMMRPIDQTQVLRELEKAIADSPWFPKAHYVLGIVHARGGQVPRAAEELKISIRMDRFDYEAHMALGLLYKKEFAGGEDEQTRRAARLAGMRVGP